MKKYKHALVARHIMMIAIGSAIGTGFFYSTAQSIRLTGPSILVAYLLGGLMMYLIISALGEMSVVEPNSGSFSFFAYRYVGDWAGFISGWNYWFNYIIVSMLELSASSLFLDYWYPGLPHWLSSLGILAIFSGMNLLRVRYFGEMEFWFSGIKVIAILCMICFGLYILLFSPKTDQGLSNISNLWLHGGFFAHGLHGFLSALVVVFFSFGGTELVGITAGETEQPQKNIPLAINGTIIRVVLFYVLTLLVIICLYPWDKLHTNISPFVDVFQQMGISRAASLINFVAITAAMSSLNSGIYGTSRMLRNLSLQGDAPKFLNKLSRNSTPYRATLFSILCIGFTVWLNYLYPKKIFNFLLSIATIASLINWLFILLTHHYFKMRNRVFSSFRMLAYPYSSLIAVFFLLLVMGSFILIPEFVLALWVAPLWMGGLYCAYKVKK